MDTFVNLRPVVGILCMVGTCLVILPYFTTPEGFFIKRLRPKTDHKITHAQLLARAFIGVGLIHSSVHLLAFSLILDFSLYLPLLECLIVACGCLFVGSITYFWFRSSRYRKLAPDELRAAGDDGSTGIFVLRP